MRYLLNSLYKHIAIAMAFVVSANFIFCSSLSADETLNKGSVERGLFTTALKDREPVNRVLSLSNRQDTVYYFSELRDFQGQTIFHKWYYENELILTTSFMVKGPRWRIFSKAKIEPQQIGKWKVVIYGENNWPVKASVFNVVDGNAEQVILPYTR